MNPINGLPPKDPSPKQPLPPSGSAGFSAAFQAAQTEWLYAVQAANPQRSTEKTKRKRVGQAPPVNATDQESDALVNAILSTLSAILDDEDERET